MRVKQSASPSSVQSPLKSSRSKKVLPVFLMNISEEDHERRLQLYGELEQAVEQITSKKLQELKNCTGTKEDIALVLALEYLMCSYDTDIELSHNKKNLVNLSWESLKVYVGKMLPSLKRMVVELEIDNIQNVHLS